MRTLRTRRNPGFTLIELIISMTILAFISLGVYQLTANSFEMREKLEAEADFYNTIRTALAQMERDVLMIYTPQVGALPRQLAQATVPGQQGQGSGQTAGEPPFDPGVSTPFWGPLFNRFGVRPSRLQGEAGKISFISSSHVRLFKDSHETEFAKITYALEDDRLSRGADGSVPKALVRYEDHDAFTDDGRPSETNARYVLLVPVVSLKFTFLDGRNDQWQNNWDTDGRDTKNQYPALIKVALEMRLPPPAPKDATFEVVQVIKPELAL